MFVYFYIATAVPRVVYELDSWLSKKPVACLQQELVWSCCCFIAKPDHVTVTGRFSLAFLAGVDSSLVAAFQQQQ
jgi:hypothetical protein